MIPRVESGVRIRVEARSVSHTGYEVVVRHGVLDELASRASAAAPAAAYAVITPATLVDRYGARAVESLRTAGLRAELLTFDDRESRKTRETWAALTDRMLELRFGRDACVIAVGGGVTGDVAGFIAATYMRGIPFVQVPTTLLAMIDASVGGKTGVDTGAGKNLVGAFHSPEVVLVDPAVLHSLPAAQLRSGLAEAVKHGAILDADYFAWIGRSADDLLACDTTALEHLIARSVQLKAGVVSEDPLEAGRRAILNFGHTIGHALERLAGYTMPHGFAVSVGMCMEAALGESLGISRRGTSETIAQLCTRLGLPVRASFDPDALMETMQIDKKARAARPHVVLLRSMGECARDGEGKWTHAVDSRTLQRVLQDGCAASDVV